MWSTPPVPMTLCFLEFLTLRLVLLVQAICKLLKLACPTPSTGSCGRYYSSDNVLTSRKSLYFLAHLSCLESSCLLCTALFIDHRRLTDFSFWLAFYSLALTGDFKFFTCRTENWKLIYCALKSGYVIFQFFFLSIFQDGFGYLLTSLEFLCEF